MKAKHLILFDDRCSFCRRSVSKVSGWDKQGIFQMAPLLGKTAQATLKEKWNSLKNADTMILIENFHRSQPQIWLKGRAVFRIFWLLGGWRKILGLLSFVPLCFDSLYQWVAARRHRFGKKSK